MGAIVQAGVPCMLMRGGTSKGAYLLAHDLPEEPAARDALLLRIMGSPDPRQIDGLGGAHPLTSKVAIVRPLDDGVEYLFLQVSVDEARVSDRQGCGNLLAGVGPFAIERGLVPATDGVTDVRIVLANTGGTAVAHVETPGGRVAYDGDTAIDGVPGTGRAIVIDFDDVAGSTCGHLLPTGEPIDVIEGVETTLVDDGMPTVVVRAADVGVVGDESPAALDADAALRDRIERIRLVAGERMGLGDVRDATIPKVCLVSPPTAGGSIATRTFIPHRCHDAIGVLCAASVAAAASIPGSVAHAVAAPSTTDRTVLEHATGSITIAIEVSPDLSVVRTGVVRTARPIMDGVVHPRPTPDA